MNARFSIPAIVRALLFLTVFITPSVFRVREYGSDSIDFQILLKLGLWCGALGFCLIYFQKWGRQLFQTDNIALSIIFGLMALSCLYAPSPFYSAGAVISVLAVVGLFFFAQRVLDEQTILWTVLSAFTLICVLSFVVYIVNPHFGRALEWVNGMRVPGNRLSGIAGTPNTVGYFTAISLIIAYALKQYYQTSKTTILYWFAGLNGAALLLSNSRTSLFALIISFALVYFLRPTFFKLFLLCAGFCAVTVGLLVIDLDWLLGELSRSGNPDEILTGRSHIWPLVWDLIQDKPFLGWGYASSSFVLVPMGELIGHTPTHSHNAFLQLWFSLGIFALLLYIVFLFMKVTYAVKEQDYMKLMMISFLLLTSLTESSVWMGVANIAAILLAMIVSMPYRNFQVSQVREYELKSA